MDIKNALEILDMVESDITMNNLKSQWKRMSFENHPDRGGDENKIKLINEAYEILKQDIKNKVYLNADIDEFISDILTCIIEDEITSW